MKIIDTQSEMSETKSASAVRSGMPHRMKMNIGCDFL